MGQSIVAAEDSREPFDVDDVDAAEDAGQQRE